MYELNCFGYRKFRYFEMVAFVVYILMIILVVGLKVTGDYYWLMQTNYILIPGSTAQTIILAGDLTPILSLSVIFIPLMYQLKHYHYFEYKRLRLSIIIFYLAETSLFILKTTSDYLYKNHFKSPQIFEYILIYIGIFPL